MAICDCALLAQSRLCKKMHKKQRRNEDRDEITNCLYSG